VNKSEFEAWFKEMCMPSIYKQERLWDGGVWRSIDKPLRREVWNNAISDCTLDGMISERAENWSHPTWLERSKPVFCPDCHREHFPSLR
jgi:hypothetical protein